MKESKDITIEKYYNDDVASIKDGVTENLISIKAIVVSVNEYPRYKFLIEEPGKITKVLSEEIKDTTEITDFKEIEEFEKDIMDQTNEGNGEESKGPIVNISNIVITLEDGTSIPEDGVDEGTKLKIEFDISVNPGSIVGISPGNIQNGKGNYITTGNEKDVIITITTQLDGQTYTCKKEISLKDKYKKNEFSATEIAKKPTQYYGGLVSNYKNDAGINAWRIFYADDENIYLIADNYLAYYNAPAGKSGGTVGSINSNTYGTAINVAKDNYPERNAWTRENSKGKIWLEDYLVTNRTGYSHEQVVAYLMDTNIFSKFVDTNVAEYCLGGPPLPMFIKSYNDVFTEEQIQYKYKSDAYCYNISKDNINYDSYLLNLGDKTTEYNGIYFKSYSGVNRFYLIGPLTGGGGDGVEASASHASTQCAITYSTCYSSLIGMRPIVCLKSKVILKKVTQGEYTIMLSE